MRFSVESELTSIKNKLARWFSNLEAKSGLAVIKIASMPEDVVKLDVEGIIQIWKAAKIRGLTRSRAEKFVAAAKESIGMKHGAAAAKLESNVLIEDFESKTRQMAGLVEMIRTLLKQMPGGGETS